MSEFKHTPGQIRIVDDRELLITYRGDPILIAEVFDTAEGMEGSDGEADANAERIRACWNACDRAGLSDEALDADAILKIKSALRAVLLFYGPDWSVERQAEWKALVGPHEAHTRGLCDFVRETLAKLGR
jgi:hypothetical protein